MVSKASLRSIVLLELSALLLLLCGAGAAVLLVRQERALAAMAAQAERSAAARAECRWWRESQMRLAEWQEVTESSVDGGVRATRAVHQGIAAVPFTILESIPATRDTTKLVRGIHDFTADNVYAAISAANRFLGQGSRRAIHRADNPSARPADGAPPIRD